MRHSIALNKQIQCENICKIVQKIVNDFIGEDNDISQSVLVLDIIIVTDGGHDHIPKLEYKPYQ